MANDISSINEGLRLSKRFLEDAAQVAFLQGPLAKNPYPSQKVVLNGHTMVLALFGGNQCLRGDMPVMRMNGARATMRELVVGDWILGFDTARFTFTFVEVRGIYISAPLPVLRFEHAFGALECTASHKVLRVNGDRHSNRVGMARVNRAWRAQNPVVGRGRNGGVETTLLNFIGQVAIEETFDLLVDHPSHAFVADNLVVSNSGKSHAAAHRVAWDATGLYPDWYTGPKTERGPDMWVIGDTNENTRDNCQRKLFGPNPDSPGWTDKPGEEALLHTRYIVGKPTRRTGVPGAFDSVFVKHVPSDTLTKITFKSHSMDQQALASWTGDRVWVDEELPKEKFDELLMRIIRRQGQLLLSFTPLLGLTDLVKFLLAAPADTVTKDFLGWDQVRHLSEASKDAVRRMYASQPGVLKARMEGKPTTNSGLIFPFASGDISYDPAKLAISTRWLYLGGLDVGWRHPTGAVATAWDPMTDVAYLYATYKQAERPYLYHHAQLQGWGPNMTFMIDPASSQVNQGTGMRILEELWKLAHGKDYEDIPEDKRKYIKADNTFLTTMDEMWHRFETRRLLVNKDCLDWFEEYQGYAWNEDGTGPVKKRDDLIDPTRYCVKKLRDFAHRLDEIPPWAKVDYAGGFEGTIDVPDWKRYAAGNR